jgi:hypothetical protein
MAELVLRTDAVSVPNNPLHAAEHTAAVAHRQAICKAADVYFHLVSGVVGGVSVAWCCWLVVLWLFA